VRAAVRDPGKVKAEGVEAVAFDFGRKETFGPALAGVTRLFLLRPPPAGSDVLTDFLRAARGAGVRHVVFLSLLGAESAPFMPHARIEKRIAAEGLPCTSLRAGFFMQNLSTTHRDDIRLRDEIFLPAGKGLTSFVDTRDIALVAAKALTEEGHAGRAYDLTGSEALDFHEVAAIFSEVLGRRIRYAEPGAIRFVRGAVTRGVPLPMALVMTGIYTVTRVGRAGRVAQALGELLGRPPITVRRFVEDHAALFR
jgi:uncharacterized protein YbjT (DUF2867 family)